MMSDSEPVLERINLLWKQRLAASWAIYWPAWCLYYLFWFLVLAQVSLGSSILNSAILFWSGTLGQLLGQRFFAIRLVRKNYRSFWVGVIVDGPNHSPQRRLTARQLFFVWFQLAWPQFVFHVGVYVVLSLTVTAETIRNLNGLIWLVRVLAIGPAAIQWAMDANYRQFRLQAYRT